MSLNKELPRFLVAGFSAVGTDGGTYLLLLNWLEEPYAKGISFILGSIVAFIVNKFWTFETRRLVFREIGCFISLYTSTLIVNVAVNQIVLVLFPMWIMIAFLFATGASTVLNFIGMKYWVFNSQKENECAE